MALGAVGHPTHRAAHLRCRPQAGVIFRVLAAFHAEGAAHIADDLGTEVFAALPFDEARLVFEQVALSSEFIEFLTLPAYELLN